MHETPDCGFGDYLRRLRLDAGLTQDELASRSGLTVNAIGTLERGERRRPYPQTVRSLADALGLTDDGRAALAAAARGQRPSAVPSLAAIPASVALPDAGFSPLPVPATRVVGRDRSLVEVAALLARAEPRLLTLIGPGGVGKTRLALEVAGQAAPAFADGVAFVHLAPLTDAALVGSTIASALGLRVESGRDAKEALRAFLRTRRLLLVLDNVEHLLAAAPDISDLLARSPGLKVLTTSRAPLRIRGEQEFVVEPLDVPDLSSIPSPEIAADSSAVHLFVERARAVSPSFALTRANAAAVAAICRRVDGLPLAIELAAAWVRLLPPVSLLARLEQTLPILTGGARDLPERQRTMRDAVAWSYGLLAADERALFRRLSVFSGGFDLDAAQAVSDALDHGTISVLAGVAAISDASLLLPIPARDDAPDVGPRFGMLETVREFGLEVLTAGGETDGVRQAHAEYVLAMTERAAPHLLGPDSPVWLDRLQADLGNLRAALAWFVDASPTNGLRVASALGWFWHLRGHIAEGRDWLDRLLAATADSDTSLEIRSHALLGAGFLAWAQGDSARADAILADALTTARAVGDASGANRALHLQAMTAWGRGDYPALGALAAADLNAATELGDARALGSALIMVGIEAFHRGDTAQSETALIESEAAYRATGFARGISWAIVERASVLVAARRPVEAALLMRDSISICAEAGDPWGLFEVFIRLAALAAARGRTQEAARMFGVGDAIHTSLGVVPFGGRAAYERTRNAARDALGKEAFAAAHASGQALPRNAAVAEALALATSIADEAPAALTEPASVDYPRGLSAREVEVLALLAGGLSNAQIADRLFLSTRTVHAHLHRIYGKLDVTNRGAATRFAVENGLV